MIGFLPVVIALAIIWFLLELRLSSRKLQAKLRLNAWPSFVEAFTSALQAGISITEAFHLIADFNVLGLQNQLVALRTRLDRGERLEDVLEEFRKDVNLLECDFFVKLLIICHRNGGSGLIRSLTNHASLSRRHITVVGDASARHGAILAVGRLGISAPWILLTVLGVNETARKPFDSPAGIALLLCGLLVSATAFYLMKKTAALPSFTRVFQYG